jgi:hypothetical protein
MPLLVTNPRRWRIRIIWHNKRASLWWDIPLCESRLTPSAAYLYQKDRRPLRESLQIYIILCKIPLLNVLSLTNHRPSLFLFSCVCFKVSNKQTFWRTLFLAAVDRFHYPVWNSRLHHANVVARKPLCACVYWPTHCMVSLYRVLLCVVCPSDMVHQ